LNPSFAQLGLPVAFVDGLARRGIDRPFPVQAEAIPAALDGRDVAACAPTGSGKTLAFGLPLISRVAQAVPHRPRALVLAPTRELANQIARELRPLAKVAQRRVLAVFGGAPLPAQRRELAKGVDVLVACPGRLEDLVARRIVDLADVDIVVIDEADRMADMGFLPAVRRIVDAVSPERQVMLFSATLDGEVGALVRRYQRDPHEVDVAHEHGKFSAADHVFHVVERARRNELLGSMLADSGATIVFCRTRHGVDRLVKHLVRAGVSAVALHGGHVQSRRTRALDAFTSGRATVLVATDVAARGIHVDDVEQVVHFDLAEDAKTYVHRSGRTARAGAKGNVVSFVGPDDARQVSSLRRELGLTSPASGSARPQAKRSRSRHAGNARRKARR
jgi:superfamily II DNA/RNA helicase